MDQNRMQPMFGALSSGSEVMQGNARSFWEGQDELLDKMQAVANGWFERRHAGTKAALEASQSLCAASSPLEFFGAYQTWMTGVLERLMADGLAYQTEINNYCAGLAPSLLPSLMQEQGDDAEERPKRRAVA